MSSEVVYMLCAFRLGIGITFLYDCLRVFRRVLPHSGFWVSLEDLLFWCYCTAEVFLMMNRVSNGILRWYAVLGALAGMGLYLGIFSKPFVRVGTAVWKKPVEFLGKIAVKLRKVFTKNRLTVIRKMLRMSIRKQ